MAEKFCGVSQVLFNDINWYFNIDNAEISDDLKSRLREEAEDKARNDIIAGCVAGELCFSDYEGRTTYYGWWSFE
jgi:hypothetical protein